MIVPKSFAKNVNEKWKGVLRWRTCIFQARSLWIRLTPWPHTYHGYKTTDSETVAVHTSVHTIKNVLSFLS